MAFCGKCGVPLQPKIQDKICPSCGKVIGKGDLQFCPYCGYKLAIPGMNKPCIIENSKSDLNSNVCPACGRVIHAQNLKTCPYCGYKSASLETYNQGVNNTNKAGSFENTIKPTPNPSQHLTNANKDSFTKNTYNPNNNGTKSSEEESSSQTSLTAFIGLCVGSLVLTAFMPNLILSNICLGLIPIVAFGAAKGYHQKNRTLPLVIIVVLSIITICGLLIMKSVGKETIRNSVMPTKSGSVTQTEQTSNKETASDVIQRYYKPDLKTLKPVQNMIFTNEMEAEAEILPTAERCAIDATKLLLPSVNYPRLYCISAFDTFLGRDQQYNIIIAYCLIDTITYPQKDLMDYWEIGMTETFVNNKVKEHGFPKVIHKQFNKQTNEERVIEKRMLGYGKSDGKPKFLTANELPQALSLSAEEMAFKKRKIPWQEIKNERMRKFYEFF